MTKREYKKYIEELHEGLPLPSEVKYERIQIPIITKATYAEPLVPEPPRFGRITFRKQYHKGICIGWELDK